MYTSFNRFIFQNNLKKSTLVMGDFLAKTRVFGTQGLQLYINLLNGLYLLNGR